jgi:DNA-binding transcriptional ArsR family regulator
VAENTARPSTLQALQVIADPVRIRIYEVLVRDGPCTVSQLAHKAKLAIGSASYHLQRLNRAGFVEEAAGEPSDRRTHWWRAVPGGMHWSPADFLESTGGRTVSSAAQRAFTERRIRRLGRWATTWHRWSKEWVDAAVETDGILRLTPAELAGMAAELTDVMQRWAGRADVAASSGALGDRQPVFVLISAFPLDAEE